MMRATTRAKIDACHAEIARLIEMEKAHHDETHPDENEFIKSINHCKIEYVANSPEHRAMMFEATASFPRITQPEA